MFLYLQFSEVMRYIGALYLSVLKSSSVVKCSFHVAISEFQCKSSQILFYNFSVIHGFK